MEATSSNRGSGSLESPFGPPKIAVLGREPSIGRASTDALEVAMSAIAVEVTPANCVLPWAGVAWVMAIRVPLRWATAKRCSPLSWPAIVHGPAQVSLPSAIAGSAVARPVLEPGV